MHPFAHNCILSKTVGSPVVLTHLSRRGVWVPRDDFFFPCILKCCTLFVELGGSRIENKGRLVGRGAEASSPPPSLVVKSHTCAVLYAVMNLYASSRTCQGLPSEWLACSACVWSALLCACPLVTSFGITVRVSICVCSTCNESFKQRGREGRRSGSVGQQWSSLRLGTHLG